MQNRASQSHTSAARGDVQVERRGNISAPRYSTYSALATPPIPSPPASPKDEEAEGHAYYLRRRAPNG